MSTHTSDEESKMGSGWTPKPPSGAQADGGVTYGHQRIFVKKIKGYFQRYRWWSFAFFLTLFAILPWLQFNGRRAVLFDIPARKFYLFNVVVWPQEFYLLTAMLLLGAMGLFFLTTLVGRLWCGYLCPQTVVTNLFLTVERWIEGDRAKQIQLANAPWRAAKIGKFALKHAVWAAMGAFFGFTFISYFVPQSELWHGISHLQPTGATIAFLSVAAFTVFDGGFFREQMCLVPCPYGRFQGVLIDKYSLTVAYDEKRGDPRGRKRPSLAEGPSLGDCVDCQLCVQVCPTGIDIRNGQQYECISCAACVDACDSVMTKLERPTGLIRYTSMAEMEQEAPRTFRFRPVLYGSILAGLGGFVLITLVTRPEMAIDVIRDRSSLSRTLPSGEISNQYLLKVMNKADQPHRYRITVPDLAGARLMPADVTVAVPSGEVFSQNVSLVMPQDTPAGSTKFHFQLEAVDGADGPVQTESRFFVPFK